jgi:hypothetical protein
LGWREVGQLGDDGFGRSRCQPRDRSIQLGIARWRWLGRLRKGPLFRVAAIGFDLVQHEWHRDERIAGLQTVVAAAGQDHEHEHDVERDGQDARTRLARFSQVDETSQRHDLPPCWAQA